MSTGVFVKEKRGGGLSGGEKCGVRDYQGSGGGVGWVRRVCGGWWDGWMARGVLGRGMGGIQGLVS